eukprot:1161276-Pelagomonas_calceolata.AAC.7
MYAHAGKGAIALRGGFMDSASDGKSMCWTRLLPAPCECLPHPVSFLVGRYWKATPYVLSCSPPKYTPV